MRALRAVYVVLLALPLLFLRVLPVDARAHSTIAPGSSSAGTYTETGTRQDPGGPPQSPADPRMDGWRRDLRNHRPGDFDETARRIAAMPWADLRPELEAILDRGDDLLLLRTATLLTDVAVHVPLDERPHSTADGRASVSQDGGTLGVAALDPHLSWSRRLIDRLARNKRSTRYPEMRAHALAWYRAVAAWLAGRLNLADLGPHVQRSLQIFPGDAGVLADAACYFETFASPLLQATMAPASNAKPVRRRARPRMDDEATTTGNLLELAERHFRKALEIDAAQVEARVRLGRVLTLRGRLPEAKLQLERATAEAAADPRLGYLAHLFLGRALEEAGQTDAAARAYDAADRIVPGAQSVGLARASLSSRRGDAAAARDGIERFFTADAGPAGAVDPWWTYHRTLGRDAGAALEQFAGRVRAVTDDPGARRPAP